MHIEEYGSPTGPAIVFLHGSLVAGWMWTFQVEQLNQYRCIVPDLPGFGDSGEQPWQSFEQTADDVAALISELAGQAHVVGLSLGGLVGLHLADRHPGVVSSLVVSGVPQGPIPMVLKLAGRAMSALYRRRRGAALVARGIGLNDQEAIDLFVKTAEHTHPDAVKTITEQVENEPLPSGLDRIEVSTLVVVGERDTKPAQRGAIHLAQHLPKSTGCSVPDVGHPWNAENPTLFTDMVRVWVDEGRPVEGLHPLSLS